ncbi:hypothetical protein Tco_1539024 [Tanacetum coccineum]
MGKNIGARVKVFASLANLKWALGMKAFPILLSTIWEGQWDMLGIKSLGINGKISKKCVSVMSWFSQNKLDDKDTNSEDSLKHPPGFTPLTHNCENDTSEKKVDQNDDSVRLDDSDKLKGSANGTISADTSGKWRLNGKEMMIIGCEMLLKRCHSKVGNSSGGADRDAELETSERGLENSHQVEEFSESDYPGASSDLLNSMVLDIEQFRWLYRRLRQEHYRFRDLTFQKGELKTRWIRYGSQQSEPPSLEGKVIDELPYLLDLTFQTCIDIGVSILVEF